MEKKYEQHCSTKIRINAQNQTTVLKNWINFIKICQDLLASSVITLTLALIYVL